MILSTGRNLAVQSQDRDRITFLSQVRQVRSIEPTLTFYRSTISRPSKGWNFVDAHLNIVVNRLLVLLSHLHLEWDDLNPKIEELTHRRIPRLSEPYQSSRKRLG